jgi:Zn-dependent protease with chaperone function
VILAHELAHHVHRDLWRGIAVQSGIMAGGFFVASLILRAVAGPLALRGLSDPAGLPVLMLAGGVWVVPGAAARQRHVTRAGARRRPLRARNDTQC